MTTGLAEELSPSIAEILGMRPWKHALFTTYTLSLSYFESEILRSLLRAGCSDISLVSDAEGYRSSLLERRSMRVGQEYRLIPVAMPKGVFHAKCIYLGSEAVALGLVDAEGARADAIVAAAEMANLRNYSVVNLIEQSDGASGPDINDYHAAVQRMVDQAPPDAVFLLDSRIPLQGLRESGDVERHLLHLRDIAPATLNTVPLHSPSAQQTDLNTMDSQLESNSVSGDGP